MTQTPKSIGFIGGGRVARVLVGGWRHGHAVPETVSVNEPDDVAFARLVDLCPEVHRASLEQAAGADVVFLALHPPVMATLLPALGPHLGAGTIVVSLAPRIPLTALETGLGTGRVARMIPNAPSLIGRGYNPIAFGAGLDQVARHALADLFGPWGEQPEVDERDLEAYAVLTGMGPTYFWYQWQALRDAASQFGLSRHQADTALRHMLEGAVATLIDAGLPPSGVMDLIPVRPLESIEAAVTEAYATVLPALFAKIRPTP